MSWSGRILGGVFLLAGLMASGASLRQALDAWSLASRAETAEGLIEAVNVIMERRGQAAVADVTFTTHDGRTVRTALRRPTTGMSHGAGEVVPVFYDPADPTNATLEPLAPRVLGALVGVPFGVAFAALGLMVMTGWTRWPVLVMTGAAAALVVVVSLLLAVNGMAWGLGLPVAAVALWVWLWPRLRSKQGRPRRGRA